MQNSTRAQTTKDLVAKIDSGDFAYKLESKNPIVKGSCVPLFGKYYEVTKVVTSGTRSITFDLSKGCK